MWFLCHCFALKNDVTWPMATRIIHSDLYHKDVNAASMIIMMQASYFSLCSDNLSGDTQGLLASSGNWKKIMLSFGKNSIFDGKNSVHSNNKGSMFSKKSGHISFHSSHEREHGVYSIKYAHVSCLKWSFCLFSCIIFSRRCLFVLAYLWHNINAVSACVL